MDNVSFEFADPLAHRSGSYVQAQQSSGKSTVRETVCLSFESTMLLMYRVGSDLQSRGYSIQVALPPDSSVAPRLHLTADGPRADPAQSDAVIPMNNKLGLNPLKPRNTAIGTGSKVKGIAGDKHLVRLTSKKAEALRAKYGENEIPEKIDPVSAVADNI